MHTEPNVVKDAWAMIKDILSALERIEAEDARRTEAAEVSRRLRGEAK